jgi:hypothetical protein
MKKSFVGVLALVGTIAVLAAPVRAGGGRYPLWITKIHGRVEIRSDKPGSKWHAVKPGALWFHDNETKYYLLRTSSHSYVHFSKVRCLDSHSLIRINWDTESSIDVLRGQMSAVDGKRGPSLRDWI